MIFVVMVVVIIAFIALWNFDLHKIIYIKTSSLNASDAAAIAGARWQGITLNILGELNIAQAVALDDALMHPTGNPSLPDFSKALAIAELGSRIYYAGPMVGYAAAQQAAKNNGAYVNAIFTTRVHHYANTVRRHADGNALRLDYADMLDAVASEGIAAVANETIDHPWTSKKNYKSIESLAWCSLQQLLRTYGDWQTFPPLIFTDPLVVNTHSITMLAALDGWMGDPGIPTKALQQLSTAADKSLSTELLATNIPPVVPATWFCYDNSWNSWSSSLTNFPFITPIKPQYDVAGAAIIMRVSADPPPSYFNKSSHHVTSISAAKPFGYLNGSVLASAYGIILPAFHAARLIPIGSALREVPPDDDPENVALDDHVENHLPLYLKYGPTGIQDLAPFCQLCRDLLRWEDPIFRTTGLAWLSTNTCPHNTGGGGGGGGGGSRYGH